MFVFVHGGGFIGGDKHVPGSPAYDFLGAWAVRNGWVGVTITYRLAPGHTWPSGAQDVASAVAWIRNNIADYGGDPDRIVVAGNSAGAVHVASYVTGQASAGQDSGSLDGVRGAAILSGFYQVALDERGDLERAYYGDTPARGRRHARRPGRRDSSRCCSPLPSAIRCSSRRRPPGWPPPGSPRTAPRRTWSGSPGTTTSPASARSAWTTPRSAPRSPVSSTA